ncbi:MAG: hypothetical protein IJX96_01210 [Clostridia bacterium]|nr:hypothetical protein [Clostridia bacterium]
MKNILSALYNGELHEWDRSPEEFKGTEEWIKRDEAYEKLEKALSKEQQDLFEEYYHFDGGCLGLELERAYANGVRTGMLLAMEALKFEP